MTIIVYNIDTTYRKILVYDKNRVSLVIRNMSTTNDVYISYEPVKDELKSFKLAPLDGLSFNKELGDETDLEMYAYTNTGSVQLAIIEFFRK